MKKAITITIVSVICAVAVGVSLYILLHNFGGTSYCQSFSLKIHQISISPGQKLSIDDDIYNILPSGCKYTPEIEYDDGLTITNDGLYSNILGSYTVHFHIKASPVDELTDELKVKVVSDCENYIDLSQTSYNMFVGETKPLNFLDYNIATQSIYDESVKLLYSTNNICSISLNDMTITAQAIGSTKVVVYARSSYGLTISDEITINVSPIPERFIESQCPSELTADEYCDLTYSIIEGNSQMTDQTITLTLLSNNEQVDYLVILSNTPPHIIFKITTAGQYVLHIVSNGNSSVTLDINITVS